MKSKTRIFPICTLHEDYLLELLDATLKEEKIEIKITEELIQDIVNSYETHIANILESCKDDELLTDVIKFFVNEIKLNKEYKRSREATEKLLKIEFEKTELGQEEEYGK